MVKNFHVQTLNPFNCPNGMKKFKPTIDKALMKHYGFNGEELDFIINYDIKYRMGSELEGEEYGEI